MPGPFKVKKCSGIEKQIKGHKQKARETSTGVSRGDCCLRSYFIFTHEQGNCVSLASWVGWKYIHPGERAKASPNSNGSKLSQGFRRSHLLADSW